MSEVIENQIYSGDKVIYVPNHAQDNWEHPDCQRGVVSTVKREEDGRQQVWVRYSEGPTGELTPIKNLVIV